MTPSDGDPVSNRPGPLKPFRGRQLSKLKYRVSLPDAVVRQCLKQIHVDSRMSASSRNRHLQYGVYHMLRGDILTQDHEAADGPADVVSDAIGNGCRSFRGPHQAGSLVGRC